MAVPFVVDVVTSCAYAAVNQEPEILLPSFLQSAIFLVIGVGGAAYFLIRPIRRFIARDADFAETERCLSYLPRRSATVVAVFYLPMISLRLLAPRSAISFGSPLEVQTWTDFASSFVVIPASTSC